MLLNEYATGAAPFTLVALDRARKSGSIQVIRVVPAERNSTLAMTWPTDCPAPSVVVPSGYRLSQAVDIDAFTQVQAAIGFSVTAQHITTLKRALSTAILFHQDTPVAAACCERVDTHWAELGWVAVDPKHRGKALGAVICAAAVADVLTQEQYRPFGSTQDHRIHALRIYFELGFRPVYREEKVQRWRSVCAQLSQPFDPDKWGWPAQTAGLAPRFYPV